MDGQNIILSFTILVAIIATILAFTKHKTRKTYH